MERLSERRKKIKGSFFRYSIGLGISRPALLPPSGIF